MNFKKVLITTSLVVSFTTSIFANVFTYSEEEITTTLMDGLVYKEIAKITNEGFLDIYILEYDINNENVQLDILRSTDEWSKRVPLTEMMIKEEVLAGVNASFFDTSSTHTDILGMEYKDGKLVYAKNEYNRNSLKSNSLNFKNDGTISFDYISNQIHFSTENGTIFYVDSVNGVQDFVNPTIFTGNVITDTTLYDEQYDLYKVIIEDGVITKIHNPKEPAYLTEKEIAFVTKDYYIIEQMPIGTKVNYSVNTNFGDATEYYDLVLSGGGTILKDGQYVSDGIQVFPNKKAPRTAVGTTNDGRLITMVVDGRGVSIGATYEQVATYLQEQGVTNAITLDGGGSSEMATINHNNVVVIQNNPSDGKERKISNGLGFVSNVNEEEKILSRISIELRNDNLFLGNSTEILLVGYDQYNRPFYLEDSSGQYIIEGIDANFYGNVVTPLNEGIGRITATVQDLEATAFINVESQGKDINVEPYSNEIYVNESTALNATITSFQKNTMDFNINDAYVTVLNSEIGYVLDGVFYSNGIAGVANIIVQYGGVTKNIVINVKEHEITVVEPDDTEIENAEVENVVVKEHENVNNQYVNSYSVQDDKYIFMENTYGLPEITMFGKISINSKDYVNVVENNINELSQNSTLRIFSGGVYTPTGMTVQRSNLYTNTLNYTDYYDINTRVINLETFTSDSYNINQLMNLKNILNENTMKNVIIQNSHETFDYLGNTRFYSLLRQTLDEYGKYNNKNVYIVNGEADRKNISVNNIDSVTYIEIPMEIISEENVQSLNNELYFYLDNNTLKYSFKN